MNKDIELLKYKLEGLQEMNMRTWELCEPSSEERFYLDGSMDAIDRALEIVDNIDEPEVLSQEWIERNTSPVDDEGRLYIWKRDLENLIVPKQELPVVPKHVGEWITKHREKYDLYPALKELEESVWGWERTYKWYRMNTHKFVNAYLTGEYEVENEPLYSALIKGHELIDTGRVYWDYDNSDDSVFISELYSLPDNFLTEMSKAEWNELGINDSNADFIKVDK